MIYIIPCTIILLAFVTLIHAIVDIDSERW